MKKSLFFTLLLMTQSFFAGFAEGTLVKTINGYERIENIVAGDFVCSFDEQGSVHTSEVLQTFSIPVSKFIKLEIAEETIVCALSQEYYRADSGSWFFARRINKETDLCSLSHQLVRVDNCERVQDKMTLYDLHVADHHNFAITKNDIVVHNLFPTLSIGLSFAFSSAGISFEGVSFAACFTGAGLWIGAKMFGKNQPCSNGSAVKVIPCNGGTTPLDVPPELTMCPPPVIQNHPEVSIEKLNFSDKNIDQGAQAPGKPTRDDGFVPNKNWDGEKVKNPNGGGYGWPDKKGSVWIPTGPKGHRGPHWDVQHEKGGYDNVMPGGKKVGGKK